MTRYRTLIGDCRETLATLAADSVHCCVTSPPYWGLRSYLPTGHDDKHREIGSEPTPEAFVETMVQVFREVRRVLHPSGTLWLNLGDSYSSQGGERTYGSSDNATGRAAAPGSRVCPLKPKDLCMIPWRVALALQADGWWLRSVICWHKKSCMPESVNDRPTNSWEPIFLLAKSARYYYDAEAVKETGSGVGGGACIGPQTKAGVIKVDDGHASIGGKSMVQSRKYDRPDYATRNQRNVWSLGPEPFSEAHFATFPSEIPRRAILAGTSERGCCPQCGEPWVRVVQGVGCNASNEDGIADMIAKGVPRQKANLYVTKERGTTRTLGWQPGCDCNAGEPIPCTVLDPFGGSGTTAGAALALGRECILCELSSDYADMVARRVKSIEDRFYGRKPAKPATKPLDGQTTFLS